MHWWSRKHQKAQKIMKHNYDGGWQRYYCPVEEQPFRTVGQIVNNLQKDVQQQQQQKSLHQSKYSGLIYWQSLKNIKTSLQFARKKKAVQFWIDILWTDETKINVY